MAISDHSEISFGVNSLQSILSLLGVPSHDEFYSAFVFAPELPNFDGDYAGGDFAVGTG